MICSIRRLSCISPILSFTFILSTVSTCSANAMLGLFSPIQPESGICTWVGISGLLCMLPVSGTTLLLVHDHFPGYYSQSQPAECHTVYVSFCLFQNPQNKPRLVSLPHLKIKLSVCLSLSSYSTSNSFIAFFRYFATIVWLI